MWNKKDLENKIFLEDCLIGMEKIPQQSIDLILCDLPYGITRCKWDILINLNELWMHYQRIIKLNGAIVLTASQPFTTDLINSNRKLFKYSLVYKKTLKTGFLNAKKMPLREHEDILVFYKKLPIYNPQKIISSYKKINSGKNPHSCNTDNYDRGTFRRLDYESHTRYPGSIINIKSSTGKKYHPTQKPISLMEYLIKAYSNENDLVLDNCMGSGTTAIACINTNRNFIGFEKEKKYFDSAQKRINDHLRDIRTCHENGKSIRMVTEKQKV